MNAIGSVGIAVHLKQLELQGDYTALLQISYTAISHTAWEVKKRRMGVYLAYKPTHSTTGQYIAESGVLYMISG